MPVRLKESSTFSLLGYCITDFTAGKLRPVCNQNDRCLLRKQFDEECYEELQACQINGTWNCDCMDFIEPHFLSLVRCNNWIFMLCKAQRILYKRNQQVPCLHHVHQNGDSLSPVHVHVCKSGKLPFFISYMWLISILYLPKVLPFFLW